jgi:hypothetical protein
MDPLTGHHTNHIFEPNGQPNKLLFNNTSPICADCKLSGPALISKYCKILKDCDGYYIGLCSKNGSSCWEKWCKIKGWREDMSYVANDICDQFGYTMTQRLLIDHSNIFYYLKLPYQHKYNHVNSQKRSNKMDKITEAIIIINFKQNPEPLNISNITDSKEDIKDDYIENYFINNLIK